MEVQGSASVGGRREECVSEDCPTKRTEIRRTGLGEDSRRRCGSVLEDGNIVPEDGVGPGPKLLGLGGGERGQEGLQLAGKEPGRRRTLDPMSGARVLEDPADHPRVLDEGDDAHGTSASGTDYLIRCGLWTFSAFVVEDGQLSPLNRPGKESQRS